MRWGQTSQSWGRGQAKCWHWCLPMCISKPFWAWRSASVLPPPCWSTSPSLLDYTTEISPAYFHGDVCYGAYRKHLGVFADPGKDGELPEWRETTDYCFMTPWHRKTNSQTKDQSVWLKWSLHLNTGAKLTSERAAVMRRFGTIRNLQTGPTLS